MTFSQDSPQSQPGDDAPTLRISPVATTPPPAKQQPTPQQPKKSTLRRLARRIVGPTILTKK
ncbi:hypothetical protein [Saccharothrix sp.]|uniref:hypothetical protein n=1 Tax=Saccharothrix sp. TaxID=1873460 RepID=UPI00281272F0|nr:hypothetical protein [Saccharothrix sp.]